MVKTVAVETGLKPVKSFLEQQGCQVVDMTSASSCKGAACAVLTGGDQNLMGIETVEVDVPVINADGMSPEQVYQRVQNYLQ
jgi:hypothetical protein